ncbi:MAG: CDP-glucose 4,6-dehydratase [Acidobacteriaceae bacterium]
MEDLVTFLASCWNGRRVFITGHTGFKGGWLALWLARHGAQVRGYAVDPPTEPNLFTLARVGSVVDDVRGDILDRPALEAAMRAFAPEVVFHMAAQPLVRRSYADPLGTWMTNAMGTAYVLEAVRGTPSVRAVVCVTTDKCYENRERHEPYRESDALGGHDPYSSSKACAEIISAAFRSSFFEAGERRVALATARAGNVIGGGDWSEDRLVPDLIRGFHAREAVLIRNPQAIRPWQHVLEPLHGYLLLAEQLMAGHCAAAFNFGPGEDDAWTVERVATFLAEAWGEGAAWTRGAGAGVHEAGILRLDASKARAELNWQPRLGIARALAWTVEWYRAWQQGADLQQETHAQIAAYEALGRSG